ncbi:Cu-binding protein [Toensbergia leucococca]|nr:Cu-binding protein [Toensbergia leucococca]
MSLSLPRTASAIPHSSPRFPCPLKPPIPQCLYQAKRHSSHTPFPPLTRQAFRCPNSKPNFPHRTFTATPSNPYKTIQEARSRHRSGPFSFRGAIVFLTAGAGMIFYFQYEKARMERKRIADAAKGVGRPKVGGPFQLLDQEGNEFGEGDMRGKFSLVYFGFTHCPDICPEELDKMSAMLTHVSSSSSSQPLLPLFITCDPARDTPPVLKTYLREFDARIVGLTGTWDQIKAVCKAYRVYFSTPEGVKPGMDYLVDHNPEGDFVEAIGRQHSAENAARIILDHMSDWNGAVKKG